MTILLIDLPRKNKAVASKTRTIHINSKLEIEQNRLKETIQSYSTQQETLEQDKNYQLKVKINLN